MATKIFNGDSIRVDQTREEIQEHQTGSSDTESLEQRNEREILERPNQVTQDAQPGIQKAEATALVWSSKALYSTYAWYVNKDKMLQEKYNAN